MLRPLHVTILSVLSFPSLFFCFAVMQFAARQSLGAETDLQTGTR